MFKKNESNNQKMNKEKKGFQVNRVVIETYLGNNKKNENKIIKVNNNVYNIKNIDNNMSRGNLNENIIQDNKSLIKENQKIITKASYFLSKQTNFNIFSHIKKFDAPLLINNSSFNLICKNIGINNDKKNENSKKLLNKKNYEIVSSNIFVGGSKLNSNKIQITNSSKKGNLLKREITNLKNNKNLNEEQKEEINKKEIEKNNLISSLEIINKRWKEAQKEYKMRLSYKNPNEILVINMEKYKQELISKLNFENEDSKNNNNCYIFLKQDMNFKNDSIAYELMKSTSQQDFESIFNKFIICNQDNKENEVNIYNNDEILNNGKRKSKFNNQNRFNSKTNKNLYCPILVFNYFELKKIIDKIEKDLYSENLSKINNKNYTLENIISLYYEGIMKIQNIIINKEKEKIKEYLPIKVFEHKFIYKPKNLIKSKQNNLSIISNKKNNEIKNKVTSDFGQSTPISLLKEKYFIYAVSKWSKFSSINSEINLYMKYDYKSGHPKFDDNILKPNNFYLGIEKINEESEPKKSRNTSNFTGFKKTISSSKIATKISSEKNRFTMTKPSSNTSYNYNNIDVSINKIKSKSKPKIDKKKNK